MNLPYKEKSQRMVLADGQPRLVSTRIFEAIVVLQGRKIPTTFIAIPEHTNSKTLLGIDLISNARIVLNIPKWHWYFEDNPFMTFDFFKECLTTNTPKTVDACQMEFQLSSNDGKNLSMEEKKQLEELVQAHSVVFEKNDKTERQQKYLKSVQSELKDRVQYGEKDITIKYIKGIPTITKIPAKKLKILDLPVMYTNINSLLRTLWGKTGTEIILQDSKNNYDRNIVNPTKDNTS
ncbi:hypothetical protein NQ318_008394 [Aromia moschata]|uniref:Uncharacterized protein n=1 Tax=Aromia moschata TaxID=1265417 RepID=A0AAV8YIA4_9CUCU|nr:hypothetical protein NQ318_008394 [Aromia moschata]